jgi:SAM-dependent methyltransferase
LIAAFLGLGIGYAARKPRLSLRWCAGGIFFLAVLLHPLVTVGGSSFRQISDYLAFEDRHIWYLTPVGSLLVAKGLAMLAVLFLTEALVFVPLGQALAEEFRLSRRRLLDYSLNVGASLVGISLFALLSILGTSPAIWIAGATVLFLPLAWKSWKETLLVVVPMACAVYLVSSYYADGQYFWSPYQKIKLECGNHTYSKVEPPLPFCHLLVNGVHHQHILDLSDATVHAHPGLFPAALVRYGTYDLPFRLKPHPRDVLIVGSGTGNDVAAALRAGAIAIDAVEIDPTIAEIGRRLHPEKPYDRTDRVRLHVDDARAFFRRADRSYDVVTFQTLDSHTLTSNFSNVNLDSYVYTEESLAEMRRILRPSGIAFLAFYAERPFIAARIYGLLTNVFGEPPLVFQSEPEWFGGNRGVVFIAGDVGSARAVASADPVLSGWIERDASLPAKWSRLAVDLTTDDWPYLYLEHRKVPTLWILLTVLIALLSTTLAAVFLAVSRKQVRESTAGTAPWRNLLKVDAHFFFLGAGFLLLETHSITKASLFFGSTWIVSSVTIAALLILILLANAISMRLGRTGVRYAFFGLFLTLGLNFAILRRTWFLGLPGGMGPPLAALLFTLPALFAGIVFASSFARCSDISRALGSNLLGAVPGALLESASFAVGIRAVVLVALGLYLGSYWAWEASREP